MTSAQPERERTGAAAPGSEPSAFAHAEAAFGRGDHAALREALAELDRARSEALLARRGQLARAIGVDPALVAVLLACSLGLGAVCFHYLLGL
jgi:hypothetical protein